MVPQTQTTPQPRAAVRWGLIFGGVITLVDLLSLAVGYVAAGVPFRSLLATIINLALLLVAGMFAARQTGKVGSGAIAGLIAGALGSLINAIASAVIIFLTVAPIVPAGTNLTQSQYDSFYRIGVIIGVALFILVYLGLGAGIGAIGGLIGRGQYKPPFTAPAPGYGGYGAPSGAYGYPPQQQPGGYPSAPPQNPYPQYPQQPPQYPQQPPQYPPQYPQG